MTFLYTVYGVPGISSSQPVRKVEPTAAVQPVRAVTSSWMTQYGNAGQTQRAYETQKVQRQYLEAMRPTAQRSGEPPLPKGEDFSASASTMELVGAGPAILEHRGTKSQTDGEYIKKYVEQLNLARDQYIRERESSLRVEAVSRPKNQGTTVAE